MGGVIALCSIFNLELSNISNAGTLVNAIKILNFFYLHCTASNNTRLELPWLLNDVSNSSSTRKLGFRISNSKWIRGLERLHTNQIYGNPFLWYPKTWFAYSTHHHYSPLIHFIYFLSTWLNIMYSFISFLKIIFFFSKLVFYDDVVCICFFAEVIGRNLE